MTGRDAAHSTASVAERLFHAVAYEVVGVLLCSPLFAWIMGTTVAKMGALNIAISAIAMLWNTAFNSLFDRMLRRRGWTKTLPLRIAHGVGFEGGLVLFTLPLTVWWLGVGLWPAFLLDAGLLLFFLPYTVAFNWMYDALRARWLARRSAG